jgi:hypothetical protein
MKSFDVIRQAVEEPGVKAVAGALKVSPALVYKWCEAPPVEDDPDQSGAKNPLFESENTMLLFGDAKKVLQSVATELKGASGMHGGH